MNLMTYIEDIERRAALAAACGTSPEYLWQIATGWNGRRAGKALAILIEERTGGAVSRHELRDDMAPAQAKPA